jgi:hypothetical protein
MTSGHLGFKLGLMSLPVIIANELCTFQSKAAVTGFFQNLQTFISMFVALTYLPLQHSLGAFYNICFVIINIVLFCLLYSLLPETNAKRKIYEPAKSYGAVGEEYRQ